METLPELLEVTLPEGGIFGFSNQLCNTSIVHNWNSEERYFHDKTKRGVY